VFDLGLTVLGEEMMRSKLEGKPISQNLAVMDRIMKGASIRFRERNDARRLELQERREVLRASKVELDWLKHDFRLTLLGADQRDAGPPP